MPSAALFCPLYEIQLLKVLWELIFFSRGPNAAWLWDAISLNRKHVTAPLHWGLGFSGATMGKLDEKPAHKCKIVFELTCIMFMGK